MSARGSVVTVTFNDGEVREYLISASPGIGTYLANNAGQYGVLSLFNNEQSWGIPTSSIRDWSIVAAPLPEADPTEEPKP